ncbi:MAG: MBL fold metallo-hydrolase [SAR202 cluster bacterium]|jgi:ribonuclease BN (tRNA processing enzyme)|nr:MBL fold metallo-hydrolase [SAR202 cluster bacterium]
MARIHVLGAGTPTPTPTRFGSAYAVEVAGELIMVDCGPAATHKLVKAGLWPTDVDYLFFTHHHFDHDVDFPCFLLCRWDQSSGKENKLQVFGPTLTEKITEGIIGENGLFAHDWKARINHPLSQKVFQNRGGILPRTPPNVLAKDVGAGKVYSGKEWEVTAAPALHVQPYLDSLAYRIDSSEGSAVFTGDTEPCQTVVDLAKDADVLVSMCWDDQEVMEANGEAHRQCGTTGAAQMAQEAGVKKLVLVHIGPNLASHDPMEKGLGDIRSIYDGEVVFSDELLTVDI